MTLEQFNQSLIDCVKHWDYFLREVDCIKNVLCEQVEEEIDECFVYYSETDVMCFDGCEECIYFKYYDKMCDDNMLKIELNLDEDNIEKYVENHISKLIDAYKNIRRGSYERGHFTRV